MKAIFTPITKLRRQVFEAVARHAFENRDLGSMLRLPYEIVPGSGDSYRETIFKERAIVTERIRLAMGLPLRPIDQPMTLIDGMEDPELDRKVYSMPFMNVISFACNACPEKGYMVTDNCQSCLAHPCTTVCPAKAVSIVSGKSVIDKSKCLRCGRCLESCPFHAIIMYERPCAAACGVDCISSDALGRAVIDQERCVACGRCMASCPFAAIADKSQIYQLCKALMAGEKVVAEIAPAFVSQFGPTVSPEQVKGALREIGFHDVVEVAVGADQNIVEEAEAYISEVATGKQPYLATSCCPSWSVMAKRTFPEIGPCLSQALTPMVSTARYVKKKHPDAKVCFIGPCAAKKLEAMRRTIRSDVHYVITFEELMAMFVAKGIEFSDAPCVPIDDASTDGRGFAVSGGVAEAVVHAIHELRPDLEVKVDRAEGLRECKKMLALAKAGKRNGYLLEGMSCPGGCIAGAGTISPLSKAAGEVKSFKERASCKSAVEKVASQEPWPKV